MVIKASKMRSTCCDLDVAISSPLHKIIFPLVLLRSLYRIILVLFPFTVLSPFTPEKAHNTSRKASKLGGKLSET